VRPALRLLAPLVTLAALSAPGIALAQATPPAAHQDEAFDFMNLLSWHGMHDIEHESWNAYGQFTYIGAYSPGFSAPYTNANGSINSLWPDPEYSFTGSFTLFFGLKLWPEAEAYFVPEAIAERPLSNLRGLGGAIQNFELQKTGSESPQLYRSRTFIKQRIELGGEKVEKTSQPMQLAATVDSHRLVFNVGSFSILDFMDRNDVSWDPRQTFFNMAFMTYASWDFPSDARGYSYGAVGEFYWDDWAFRVGWLTPPQNPNQLEIDPRFWEFYGTEFELEHDHQIFGQPGAARLLAYRNHVDTGRFSDAINAFNADPSKNAANCGTNFNYGSGNFMAPDLCWVRQPNNKVGIGLDLEQYVADGWGFFFRGMYSDGRSEVDAFNAADQSVSVGSVAKGKLWHRPFDVTGVGFGMSWISYVHAQYLSMGGVDGFIGDGRLPLPPAAEGVIEAFYSFNLLTAIWITGDYQFIWNPAYNSDRGPVNILGGRVHVEF
jgi:hypothetical protein